MKGLAELDLRIGGTVAITFAPADSAQQAKDELTLMFDGGFVVTVDATEAMVDTDIPEGKRLKIKFTPKDVSGNPATIDGNAAWKSEDETLLQVVPDTASASQLEAWVQNAAGGSLGPTNIQVDVDADRGQGVKTVTKLFAFEAVAGEAAGGDLEQVGQLEDIPAA